MPILISRTYSETTPESAEHGEHSDCGFVAEREPVSFRDLVDLLREHPCPSESPTRVDARTWFTSHPWTACYQTGTEREESVHLHRDNPPRAARYWRKAAILAGIKVAP